MVDIVSVSSEGIVLRGDYPEIVEKCWMPIRKGKIGPFSKREGCMIVMTSVVDKENSTTIISFWIDSRFEEKQKEFFLESQKRGKRYGMKTAQEAMNLASQTLLDEIIKQFDGETPEDCCVLHA